MRRTPRASASRLFGRVCAVPLTLAIVLSTPGFAGAEPGGPDTVAALVAAVANANQKLHELGAAVQAEQENVNKALVDVQSARDAALAAERELEASRQGVIDASTAIAAAQERFDAFAASTYVNGPSGSYLTATDPADMLATAAAGQTLAASAQHVMDNLLRARTEQLNRESAARLAKQKADQASADALASQDAAVSALTQTKDRFGEQQTELDRLTAERADAQAELAQARQQLEPATGQSARTAASGPPQATAPAPNDDNWDRSPERTAPPYGDISQWDTTLPMIPSAFVSGDPIAIINAVLQIAASSLQVTADLGRKFLQGLGLAPTPTGFTNGAIPNLYGSRAVDYVIQRGMSQMGVPYSWGGGNASGPSRGIDSGAGTVGFDCSGLMLYMFAGVGIKLDHYSGSQYNAGRKIPSSQMRRGDMIFYGPNGSQHVAMYLGNGQMLEAPYTGSQVRIASVRTSGMTPYVTRMIE